LNGAFQFSGKIDIGRDKLEGEVRRVRFETQVPTLRVTSA
jgi:hypothetical protein